MLPKPNDINPRVIAAAQVTATLGLFALDLMSPPGIEDGVGYPLVLLMCLWVPRRSYLLYWMVVTTALTVIGAFFSRSGGVGQLSLVNRATALICIWAVWFLVRERITMIESLRQRERDAYAASAAKSLFLANMSHELRTPLNAIIGFADVIRTGWQSLADAKRVEYAQDIHASGMHLLALIDDLLDVARIEAGKYRLSEETIEIEELLGEALRMVKIVAELQGVTIEKEIATNLPLLYADRRAVKQALLNLLTNATKFTPRGGRVTMRAALSGGKLAIAVCDTGIGIPRAALGRLGRPFEQGERRMARAIGGAGLGLALCRGFMELHGGELAIESQEQKGTTASLVFPAGRLQPVPAPEFAPLLIPAG